MKDLNNGVATPKLELSSASILWETSPFAYAFQEPLEETSLGDAAIDVLATPLDDNAGALVHKISRYKENTSESS